MEDLLRSKGLYQITFGKEQEPTSDENKFKWANKNDKACGLIRISISPNLRFHFQGIDGLDKAWEKVEVVFGKHNIIQSHQIENQLMTLSPCYSASCRLGKSKPKHKSSATTWESYTQCHLDVGLALQG
jgi:hypothetical protein